MSHQEATSEVLPHIGGARPGRPLWHQPSLGWRRLLTSIHVASAVSLIGADLVLIALAVSGVRDADPVTVYPAMGLLGEWVLAPLAVIALFTGLLQGVVSPYGFLRYWWVTIKLVITTLLTGVALFVLVPGLEAAADAATHPSAGATLTDARRLIYVVTPSTAVALLAFMVGLAVYKPRWRVTPPGVKDR